MRSLDIKQNMTPFQQKCSEKIRLPSLTKNIHILMHELTNNELNFQQLANIIMHYPEISARLIFLVNSPWSAPVHPISSIEQACSRLGASTVKSISIAMSIASSFDTEKCSGFDPEYFWTSSMQVAEGAGLLAAELPNSTELTQTAHTAGVLHNIGLLWLADNLPKETNQALLMTAEDKTFTLSKALLQCTGADYSHVGAWIGKQWNMPEILLVAMQYHRDMDYQKKHYEMALLVGSAATMSTAIYHQYDQLPENKHLERLGLDTAKQQRIMQRLSKNFAKTHELAKMLCHQSHT